MWYGLVKLVAHENVKEAAFCVVFGFFVLTSTALKSILDERDDKKDDDEK